MKTTIIGIAETSKDVFRLTYNGSILGDSRGYRRDEAIREAKKAVARDGGKDGDWGPNGWEEKIKVLDPALKD